MTVSVVICTRNRADLIGDAVGSVMKNDHPNFEVVVIDQSDTDATRQALAAWIDGDARLQYVHTTRVGLSAAYNTGIARTSGEIVAFTDDDCVAPPDWLRQVESAFERYRDADLLYGQVLAPTRLRDAPGVLPTLAIAKAERISRRDGFKIYGMGANFAARRRLFRRIGGFDEVLGGGGPLRSSQDFDLQYRVYSRGLVSVLAPEVTVDHYGLRSADEWPKTLVAYGIGDGGFYMKHIRSGDLFALRLLLWRLAMQAPRQLVKALLQRPNDMAYIGGLARGLKESYRFSVDRKRRLYVVPSL